MLPRINTNWSQVKLFKPWRWMSSQGLMEHARRCDFLKLSWPWMGAFCSNGWDIYSLGTSSFTAGKKNNSLKYISPCGEKHKTLHGWKLQAASHCPKDWGTGLAVLSRWVFIAGQRSPLLSLYSLFSERRGYNFKNSINGEPCQW